MTLVESPDVNPIGVGEGTWPSMRDTLRKMGISETDFIRECDASFKQASRFDRWITGADFDSYYHPFALPNGYGDVNLVSAGLPSKKPFAEVVSYQPQLCHHGRAPKQITTPEWAAVANYAYHLDAGKFGQFLQKFCIEKLGVEHVLDHVTAVNSADNGDIAALETMTHGRIEGDLFIDCTGFASVLLGRHYGIPFISSREILFCDTALALQVPYEPKTARSLQTRFPPPRKPAGSGISACRPGVVSVMFIQAHTPPMTTLKWLCGHTSTRAAVTALRAQSEK